MSEPKWFVTSDPHLDHPAILEHNKITRPFKDVDEMNEMIVSNWNADVGKHDFVIIVGDLAYRNYEKWARVLNGKKYLVLGNHDYVNLEAQKHFVKVCDIFQKRILGHKFFFCHYPCLSWADKQDNSYMIHGHSHGRMAEDDTNKRCDVSMDVWGMRVVPIQVLIEKLKSKKPYPPMTAEERRAMEERVAKTQTENLSLMQKHYLS